MQRSILFLCSLILFLSPLFSGCNADGGRTTWSGTKISSSFCAMDDKGDCQFMDYGNWASKQAAAGIVMAILSLISFPVFCAGRFCCNQFGGRGRSKGICCVKKDKFKPYSWRSVVAIKILIVVCMVGILAAAIVGFAGNKAKATGITSTTTIVLNTAHELVDRATAIGESLKALPYTKDEGQQIEDVVDSVKGYIKQGDDIKATVNQYNKIVDSAMIVAFSLPLLLVVIGAVGAVFNLRWFAIVAGIFCFFCSIFIWLSFGVHQTVYAVVDDVCVEFDDYLAHDGRNSTVSKFLNFADCTKFQDFSDLATNATGQALSVGCDAIVKLCNDSHVGCDNDAKNASTCNKQTVTNFKTHTNITDYLIGCGPDFPCPTDPSACPQVGTATTGLCFNQSRTVLECSTACNNTDLRNLTGTAVTNIDLLLNYTAIVEDQILPLLNCTFITEALEKLNGAICITFEEGVHKISLASGFLGALLIPSTIILIMGFKRFRKDQTADLGDLALDPVEGYNSKRQSKVPADEEDVDYAQSPTQRKLLK